MLKEQKEQKECKEYANLFLGVCNVNVGAARGVKGGLVTFYDIVDSPCFCFDCGASMFLE